MRDECHISSLVVHARPELAADISARIAQLPGADIQPCDVAGKLIVVLETPGTAEIVERLNFIHDLPGVISAALIYHHWERAGDPTAEAESEADHEHFPPQVSQG
ncbi:MAG TPA: chaperone NapD [Dongiaceae bacterium]|nr:chaperone NapD [Dongiaceae bacterium]